MPLTHIQLRPEKLKEALKPRAVPAKKPALARRLVEGPKPYAGPTPTLEKRKPRITPSYFREPTGLAGALVKGAPDIQARAWAKRKEIVAEEQARLDTEVDALYGAVQDLSRSDQDYILSRVVGKRDAGALATALGAEPGAISPAAVRTDPLMQTLIDKHYIRLDENGQTYSWMLPEVEKKFIEMIVDPQSMEWKKVYSDGSMEGTGMFGPAEPAEVEAPKLSEQVALARLHFDIEKHGQSNVELAIKQLGDVPIIGATMRRPGTSEYRKVEQEDVDNYYKALGELAQYIKVSRAGPQTIEDIRALYANNPVAIQTVQQQLGLEPTGVWSDELEQILSEVFSRGE